MDWKYLIGLSPADLTDEKKDELLNTIAWFDFAEDEIELERCVALLKISQEIMKYKGEQVEALLAELDEIATKQGEEEAKKHEPDFDITSVRSKVSGRVDVGDVEEKYFELKNKYKKLQKTAEKSNTENEKLKENINMLEKERIHLQNELQRTHLDESSSDISETVKDQHKNLIDTVHQKNNQISQLLNDIENIEGDNLVLRKRLTTVRDELSDATRKLESLTKETEIANVKLQEMSESLEALKVENEGLRVQVVDIVEDKKQRESEFEEFAREVDIRVEEWKKILDEKNREIKRLEKRPSEIVSSSRSASSSSVFEDQSQITVLNKILTDREGQILELENQLRTATKEMEENTEIMKHISLERDEQIRKCDKANLSAKDLKKQLKATYARCQELQEEVTYQAEVIELKNNELKDLMEGIKGDDASSIKSAFEQLHDLKSQQKFKEKQISNLVRTCNKLQTSVDFLEKENVSLRDRLGLSDDDFVSTKSITSQQRKLKKTIEDLKQKILDLEEERLQYRVEIQKLSHIISNLSEQIIDLGETPNPEHVRLEKLLPVEEVLLKETGEIQKKVETANEVVEVDIGGSGDYDERKDHKEYIEKEEYVSVVEENDALRKGMHEILDSIRSKQESTVRHIKSDTLEKLLQALDVKHVSGWYHPAMRLQAEVHAIQGSNSELREQLRAAREELQKYKEKITLINNDNDLSSIEIRSDSGASITKLNMHLLKVLQNYSLEEETNAELIKKLEEYKNDFATIQTQVVLLYSQYHEEKKQYESDISNLTQSKNDAEEKAEVLETKLNMIEAYIDPKSNDDLKMKKTAEAAATLVVLNRKCIYLETQESHYKSEIARLKEELSVCESQTMTNLRRLECEKVTLNSRVQILEVQLLSKMQEDAYLHSELDKLLVKERDLVRTINDIRNVNNNELNVLKTKVALLEDEKEELIVELADIRNNINFRTDHKNDEVLARKLAQCEVNEITERQRANHMNNLYELVKDQLQKSEDRYKDFQKYNNEVMNKNLVLQESIKELEDKVLNYVSHELFKSLQSEHVELLKSQEKLKIEKCGIENELAVIKKTIEVRKFLSESERNELINLKHQIVDLQSTGDDKAVIARLSSDVVIARMVVAETKRRLEETLADLKRYEAEYEEYQTNFDQKEKMFESVKDGLEKKVRHMELIIKQQRQRYLGFVPFTSEIKFAETLKELYRDKQEAFENLLKSEAVQNECATLQDGLIEKGKILDEMQALMEKSEERNKIMGYWYDDKQLIQLQGIRYKKQAELKESQLQQCLNRLTKQDEQILKLETELLQSLTLVDSTNDVHKPGRDLTKTTSTIVAIDPSNLKSFRHTEVQTNSDINEDMTLHVQNIIINLEAELLKSRKEIVVREEIIQQLRKRITDLDTSVNMFRQQIADKQSQITFYEKHILEMQHKKEATQASRNEAISGDSEEVIDLKMKLKELEDIISDKNNTILKYQSLLKKDRDEHSLAAARFQEELKQLQQQITLQQENIEPKLEPHPGRAAIEHYIVQVHALEKHTTELHTNVSSLKSQLQAAREECVRWRTLAYERLNNMEELRASLGEQHRTELEAYKKDSEKWRDEVKNLQQFVSKYKNDISELRPDIEKEMKQKDNKIHELMTTIKQLRRYKEQNKTSTSQPVSNKEDNFEDVKENLLKEHEILKKRFDQLMSKEKNAREEIRSLKGQLMKRPMLSARSDNTISKEHQLQKKVLSLEKEIEELKEKLEHEATLNEAHKVKVSEDFDRWNKQKYWQQMSEKLKGKLKEKSDECEKLQQTCSGYRILIEKLEREKYSLEGRLKSMKTNTVNANMVRGDMLEVENTKLMQENELLQSKLEMQQLHSGGLGAAMLQEKLEAQERKIAILEMSSKGNGELRAELERAQNTISVLQKSNLRLEAENLEFRLDLEKSCNELPHLREQIVHLEHYVQVLKAEKGDSNNSSPVKLESCSSSQSGPEAKRVSELERTVFVLKRIVEKLQVENKRLAGNGIRPCTDRAASTERLKKENTRLKEQYGASAKKISRLEKELDKKSKSDTTDSGMEETTIKSELEEVKTQLKHKTDLLDKVKILLQRAAVKEKALLDQVAALKILVPGPSRDLS